MKKCSKCSLDKENEDFYTDNRKSDGLRSWCKTCQKQDNSKRESKYNEKRKEYRLKNQDFCRNKKKDYYKKKKDSILVSNKNWRQSFKGRLSSYKRGALSRNLVWSLTDEQFQSFYNLNCHYCGDKIEGVGIDRLDSKEGYTLSNSVPCCTSCNIMKMDFSKKDFLENIKKIWENIMKLKDAS